MYHCYPINHWKELTLEFLEITKSLFNGRKVVTIAANGQPNMLKLVLAFRDVQGRIPDNKWLKNSCLANVTKTQLNDAKELFLSYGFDDIIVVDRSEFCEHVCIEPSFESLRDSEGITFRFHTKGVTNSRPSDQNKMWRKKIFDNCLDVNNVEDALSSKLFCGTLMHSNDEIFRKWASKTNLFNWPEWYYAGSSYWFRNEIIKTDIHKKIPPCIWSIEYLPCYYTSMDGAANLGPTWHHTEIE